MICLRKGKYFEIILFNQNFLNIILIDSRITGILWIVLHYKNVAFSANEEGESYKIARKKFHGHVIRNLILYYKNLKQKKFSSMHLLCFHTNN